MKKKLLIPIMVLTLLIATVGGTMAWLTDKTDTVVNTFTVGNIDIDLGETTGTNYKMIPGANIAKDPKVTVEANSEACWLFVKVEKSTNFDTFMEYEMADDWIQLTDASGNDVEGVFYREVPASDADQEFGVLAGDIVTVKNTVTKDMMDAIDGITIVDGEEVAAPDELKARPTLTFTAYAVQKDGFTTPADAWAEASK